MKALLTGLAMVAAAYFVSSYNVEIKVTEAAAKACNAGDPGCD